ncbi:MAG: ChbG/HpnK family deacetylase [Hyphomicrobium sp.]
MAAEIARPPGCFVLCADDYAMTGGVSRAIEQLAEAGRISATSVMVTTQHWSALCERARALRGHVAVGLHINLTLGAPLGPMPNLAPGGRFPDIGALTLRAMTGGLDRVEVAAEVTRQIARFEDAMGCPPDHIDGHQHVHAMLGVREGVLAALAGVRTWHTRPLVRDPADSLGGILMRRRAIAKSTALWHLSRGFGNAARAQGFPTNDSFAGVTDFRKDAAATAADFAQAARGGGPLHLVMCHPGFPDDELRSIDPVTERRRAEFELLSAGRPFKVGVWRPERAADGPPVDWRSVAWCSR